LPAYVKPPALPGDIYYEDTRKKEKKRIVKPESGSATMRRYDRGKAAWNQDNMKRGQQRKNHLEMENSAAADKWF